MGSQAIQYQIALEIMMQAQHKWQIRNGEPDIFAYAEGYHNGPKCIVCGYYFCQHCNPNGWNTSCGSIDPEPGDDAKVGRQRPQVEKLSSERENQMSEKLSTSTSCLYVAVVITDGMINSEREPYGDWACFVGASSKEVIDRATVARVEWGKRGYGPYEILVGQLTGRVVENLDLRCIEVEKLSGSKSLPVPLAMFADYEFWIEQFERVRLGQNPEAVAQQWSEFAKRAWE
jgi:hypothetical protein